MKPKKYIYLLWIGLFCIFLFVQFSGYLKKKANKTYLELYNYEIRNTITYVGIRDHGSSFRIIGDDFNYVFYPVGYRNTNVTYPFIKIAKVGDSIIKEAHTNRLQLVTADTVYEYSFLDVVNN